MAVTSPKDATSMTKTLGDAIYSAVYDKFTPILKDPAYPLQYQFPLLETPARWNSGDYAAYDQLLICDSAPINHGPYYMPNGNMLIFSEYGMWLGAVRPDLTDDQRADDLRKDAGLRRLTVQDDLNRLKAAFALWKGSDNYDPSVTTLDAYIQSPYSGSLGSDYMIHLQEFNDADARLQAYMKDVILKKFRAAVIDDKFQQAYKRPLLTDLTSGKVFIGAGDNNLEKDLNRWRLGQFGGQGLGPVVVTQDTIPVREQKTITVWKKETDSFFFGLIKSTRWTTEQVTQMITTYENFNLSVTLSAINAYPVTRDGWFALDALQKYSGAELDGRITPKDFFDPEKGHLALIPAYVVVGFDPVVQLTMSNEAYNNLKDEIINKGMKIGPFIFAGTEITDTKQGAKETVISFRKAKKISELDPLIVGYIHYVTTTAM